MSETAPVETPVVEKKVENRVPKTKEELEAELVEINQKLEEYRAPGAKPEYSADKAKVEKIEKEHKAIETKIANYKKKLDEIKEKREAAFTGKNEMIAEKKVLRTKMTAWKEKKTAVDNKIKGLLDCINAVKKAKQLNKFGSVDEIEREISRLNMRLETTSMTFSEEKRAIKQITDLKKLKPKVAGVKPVPEGAQEIIKSLKKERSEYNEQMQALFVLIQAKDAEIDAESEKINKKFDTEATFQMIKSLRDEHQTKWEELKAARDVVYHAERACKDVEFHKKRLTRGKIAVEKKLNWLSKQAERDAEEAAKLTEKPWTEEMALCDTLLAFLRTHLPKEETEKVVEETETPAFEGLFVAKKETTESFFGGCVKDKKKRRKNKKKVKTLNISVDLLTSFAYLSIAAPSSFEELPAAIEAVEAKKTFLDTLPRDGDAGLSAQKAAAPAKKQQAKKEPVELFPTLGGATQNKARGGFWGN
eukprot:TRINITY_DN781862_c0_g1_i1.p1 TRINITY_DN781862_c0_g1~~TRINITY_DN781862_c0_g1_i1.p1  ORF type:complete len:476 (+),score=163.47 TRINITY_DN781862_c0_g1_i1:49-1476(+)